MSAVFYACGLDTHLKDWLSALDVKQVRHAIFFSAAWLSKHSPALIHKALQDKGIQVLSETIYCKGKAKCITAEGSRRNCPSHQCLKEQVSFICFRMNCTFSENICQFLSGIPYNG